MMVSGGWHTNVQIEAPDKDYKFWTYLLNNTTLIKDKPFKLIDWENDLKNPHKNSKRFTLKIFNFYCNWKEMENIV